MIYLNIDDDTGDLKIEKFFSPMLYFDNNITNIELDELYEQYAHFEYDKKRELQYIFSKYHAILVRPVISFSINIYKNDNKLPEINIKFELLRNDLPKSLESSTSLSNIYMPNEIARNKSLQSQRTPVRVIFMRHGYSCANLAKRLGFFKTGYLHNQYTDPELTATGIKYAKDIYNKYHKGTGLNTDQFPLLSLLYQQGIQNVCSSVLMRTQQTAQYTFDPEKITVIPYVSEEGGFEENTPIRDQSVKKNIMYQSDLYTGDPMQNTYSKLDYSLIQGISDANIPDVHKFLRWLNENYQKIRINPDVNTIIIVSHKHFMQSLHQYITGKKININNYDMLQYELELSGDRHRKIIYSPDSFTGKIFEYPNTKFINKKATKPTTSNCSMRLNILFASRAVNPEDNP
jgi:broad specificity phosphatase PhoE